MDQTKRVLINVQNNISIYIELLNAIEANILAIDKDGNESRKKFEDSISYVSGNHKFKMKYADFCNLLLKNNQSLSLNLIIERAEKCNKTIIFYHGKNKKNEQVWGVKCLLCGHEAKKFARWFNQCSGCNNLYKVTCHDEFIVAANEKHINKYLYDDLYINAVTKINIFCTMCKTFFKQTPHNHLKGTGCPKCKISKGELRIEKYLIKRKRNYTWQKDFDDLRHKLKLKLDFFCPDEKTIIEFDGEGHYLLSFYIAKRVKDPEKALREVKLRDEIKNAWAKANGYTIIRIPYWDFDRIEEILDAHFEGKYAK
jgi:hypothetical protein